MHMDMHLMLKVVKHRLDCQITLAALASLQHMDVMLMLKETTLKQLETSHIQKVLILRHMTLIHMLKEYRQKFYLEIQDMLKENGQK